MAEKRIGLIKTREFLIIIKEHSKPLVVQVLN